MSDRFVLFRNGDVVYDSGEVPVVLPPVEIPPVEIPPSSGNYLGPDMWQALTQRRDVHLTLANPVSEGHFVVPADYTGVVELEVSGANINMRVDGQLVGGDAKRYSAGPHSFDAVLTSEAHEALGSIAVVHR